MFDNGIADVHVNFELSSVSRYFSTHIHENNTTQYISLRRAV